MKTQDPFKPLTPQTGEYFIKQIKCPITKQKFQDNWDHCIQLLGFYKNRGPFKDIVDMITLGLFHENSKEGEAFWFAIRNHFAIGSGRKTYNDFKHLDNSAK